jgi:hypothetical protein
MGLDSGNPVELELMEQSGLTTASSSGMIQTGGRSWQAIVQLVTNEREKTFSAPFVCKFQC